MRVEKTWFFDRKTKFFNAQCQIIWTLRVEKVGFSLDKQSFFFEEKLGFSLEKLRFSVDKLNFSAKTWFFELLDIGHAIVFVFHTV